MTNNATQNKHPIPSTSPVPATRKLHSSGTAAAPCGSKKKDEKKAKEKAKIKMKTIREFSIPQAEYEKLDEIKQGCKKAGISVRKTELLRAGLQVLNKLSMPKLEQALAQVVKPDTMYRKKKSA